MGFEDLFENRKRYKRYNFERNHYPDYSYEDRYSRKMNWRGHKALYILERIWNNRKLRFLLILSLLILLVLIITVLILIIPLIGEILDSIAKTGLKGIVAEFAGIINSIWNGTGK